MIPMEDIEWFVLIYGVVIVISIFVQHKFHIGE